MPPSREFSAAWQMVTCSGCDASYQCTPYSDYYNATSLTDGVCERCLMAEANVSRLVVLDPKRQS